MPASRSVLDVEAIRGSVAQLDTLLPSSGTSHSKIVGEDKRWNFSHQCTRNLTEGAVPENGGEIPLLRILKGLGYRHKVGPVVSVRAEPDSVAGEVVAVDRTQARIVPGVDG